MAKKVLLGAVLIFLGIFVLSELLLPYVMGKQLEAGLGRALGTNEIQVSVKAYPALSMLGGNFSAITVKGQNMHTEKLVISQLSAVFTDTSIDLKKLLINRTLVFREIGSFDGTVILREEDINQSVAQAVKNAKNVRVTLAPEHMTVTGQIIVGPAVIALTVDGKLQGEQTQLKFIPVTGTKLGGSIVLFDLKKLPVPASIKDVSIEQDRVIIRITK